MMLIMGDQKPEFNSYEASADMREASACSESAEQVKQELDQNSSYYHHHHHQQQQQQQQQQQAEQKEIFDDSWFNGTGVGGGLNDPEIGSFLSDVFSTSPIKQEVKKEQFQPTTTASVTARTTQGQEALYQNMSAVFPTQPQHAPVTQVNMYKPVLNATYHVNQLPFPHAQGSQAGMVMEAAYPYSAYVASSVPSFASSSSSSSSSSLSVSASASASASTEYGPSRTGSESPPLSSDEDYSDDSNSACGTETKKRIKLKSHSSSSSSSSTSSRCGKRRTFTKEEDELLVKLVNKFGANHWSRLAVYFQNKEGNQLSQRWHKALDPTIKRGKWSKSEDEAVLDAVSKYGKKWKVISKLVPGRTGKQIRDRYISCLDPKLRTGKFTPEEDRLLLDAYAQFGNKWATIAKVLPHRSWFKSKWRIESLLKKQQREQAKNGLN